MRFVLFLQIAMMLCWRIAVLSLALFTVAPSWSYYAQLIIGVPLVASAVIVFGLRRTLRPFPIVRLLSGRNPLPTQVLVAAEVAAAAEQVRRQIPEGPADVRLQREKAETAARVQEADIAAHRQAELDHAQRVADARDAEAARGLLSSNDDDSPAPSGA
ncbi:hypothetical protein [Microbacterium sp. ZW T5_56]|uniref:hypothetical protein n=1 Tax=Microbacterium sp. ZW T5_56 TaxID=3378081 RepID=UPI003851D456